MNSDQQIQTTVLRTLASLDIDMVAEVMKPNQWPPFWKICLNCCVHRSTGIEI